MSRRGAFVLTAQEMRLVQELARLAAGALEKARLIDAERRNAERVAFVNRVHAALGGLTEIDAILERTVRSRLPLRPRPLRRPAPPLDQHPGRLGLHWKRGHPPAAARSSSRALFELLSAEGSYVLLPDVAADEKASPSCRRPTR